MKTELKPCPFCGGKMKADYQNNQDGERGYYAVCDSCDIYFGLDSEAVDMGYCWGKYGDEDAVAEAWNRRVEDDCEFAKGE